MVRAEENLPALDALRGLSLLLLQFVDKSIKGFGAMGEEEPRLNLEVGPTPGPTVRQVRRRLKAHPDNLRRRDHDQDQGKPCLDMGGL